MKKTLNTSSLMSELSESPFFTTNTPLPQEKIVTEAHILPPEPRVTVKPIAPISKEKTTSQPDTDSLAGMKKYGSYLTEAEIRLIEDLHLDIYREVRDTIEVRVRKNDILRASIKVASENKDKLKTALLEILNTK
jgi:hypothetical protein